MKDVDADITDAVVTDFFIHANLKGWPRQNDMREKHNDCIFLCLINATLIDEAFCADLLRVRNFASQSQYSEWIFKTMGNMCKVALPGEAISAYKCGR